MGCLYSKGCLGQVPNSPRELNKKGSRRSGTDNSSDTSDGEGEVGDQVNQLSRNRDSDVGINRLSRISSQYLPAEGSRTVRVPIGNYELRYSYLSQRGFYPEALDKPNQDSFCIHTPFGTSPDDHFFGVFDGHGEYGAQCSQFVKSKLCENLLRNSRFRIDPLEAFNSAFMATNTQLHSDSLDDTMSGTTAITVLVRGRTIYVANAGDSRAVIAEKRDKDIVAVDLSIDQTPFRTDELERVKHCGARVMTLDQIEGLKNPDLQCWGTEEGDDGDPPRLWVQNAMYPGTAFTRSIGDSVAESIGVVATPEIFVMELTQDHPFFVVASDGVFEFLSSQTVIDMVAKYKDPRDACAAVVAEAYKLWLQYETRTDDITIIVVHINGIADVNEVHFAHDGPIQPLQQLVEVAGSESPATLSLNAKNNPARHDLSRKRLRAIENSLESGNSWVPPSPSNRKTWEEEAHIENALRGHFLFRRLNDSQSQVLLDCMQRIDVKPGDTVVQQGGEGDCFYVVGSGEFEVLATQEEDEKRVTKVLQQYNAEKLSSFGELALMCNKPLQASVRAVTEGTLWSLRREDFRGILMSEFSNLPSIKLLRRVEIFSRLTILQLSRIADALLEMHFSDGQKIISQGECLSALYIVKKGSVKLSYRSDLLTPTARSLLSDHLNLEDFSQENDDHVMIIEEGSHFGEWALLGEHITSVNASSVGDVVCSVISKEKFDSIIGPLYKQPKEEIESGDSLVSTECSENGSAFKCTKLEYSDLEWKCGVYSTDCSEVGLVLVKGSDKMKSLKKFSKRRVKELGLEAQVLKERDLMKSLKPSAYVPEVLSTCADESYVSILLDSCLTCSLASILHTPLDESSARFYAASVVVSLQELHKNGILYRGVSPDALMLDRSGRLQLVDFRYAKRLNDERTFTICGIADSLAPEIILGKGHSFPADWWALGVLIFFMLQVEMPFGSWRESELETFGKIAKGQLTLPQTFSLEVVDLITKLLDVDEVARLGSRGADSIKCHQWFDGLDWNQISDGTFPVPLEVTTRVNTYLENRVDDNKSPIFSAPHDQADLNTPEWLEDW